MVEGVEEGCYLVFLVANLQLIINDKLLQAFQVEVDDIAALGQAEEVAPWGSIVLIDIGLNRL